MCRRVDNNTAPGKLRGGGGSTLPPHGANTTQTRIIVIMLTLLTRVALQAQGENAVKSKACVIVNGCGQCAGMRAHYMLRWLCTFANFGLQLCRLSRPYIRTRARVRQCWPLCVWECCQTFFNLFAFCACNVSVCVLCIVYHINTEKQTHHDNTRTKDTRGLYRSPIRLSIRALGATSIVQMV